MALTPHNVRRLLDFNEIACLLAEIGHEKIKFSAEEMGAICNWRNALADALVEGSLEPVGSLRIVIDETGEEELVTNTWMERYHPLHHNVMAKFKREDVYRWLKAFGIADDNIPEALRVTTEPQAPAEQPTDQSTEGEELRALEALGLLAETITKQAPRYQRNGKPNCAQIAEAMSQQAGEVYGMKKSKLQRLLSDALGAWEEKRR